VNLILAFAAYIAAVVAFATLAIGGCHPTPGPWRPASSVIVEERYCMATPDELLLAAQRVEAAVEALIDALMAGGLQQAEACRAHNALDTAYSERPEVVREFLAAHDALNFSEETNR
jgi:hypothetical protein